MARRHSPPNVRKPFTSAISRIHPIDMVGKGLFIGLHDLRELESAGAQTRVSERQHARIQIVFVLEGRVDVATRTGIANLEEGHAAVIPAYRPFRLRLKRGTLAWQAAVEIRGGPAKVLSDCFGSRLNEMGLVPAHHPQALAIAMEARQLAGRPVAWRERMLASLLRVWYGLLLGRCLDPNRIWRRPTEVELSERAGERVCDEAIAFMRENHGSSLQVDDIAEAVGVSGRHLNRLFQHHQRKSVHQHLLEIRLIQSLHLLKTNPELSIKQVAYRCGFRRPAHFTHVFKQRFRRLPREVHAMNT